MGVWGANPAPMMAGQFGFALLVPIFCLLLVLCAAFCIQGNWPCLAWVAIYAFALAPVGHCCWGLSGHPQ